MRLVPLFVDSAIHIHAEIHAGSSFFANPILEGIIGSSPGIPYIAAVLRDCRKSMVGYTKTGAPKANGLQLRPRPPSIKIGRPGYRVTKQFDPETKQRSLLFQIEYPEIEDLTKPRHRFMSSYEQRIESCDKRYQYLLFAADPYEIIAFKVPSIEIDKSSSKLFTHWDPDSKMFTLQLHFKVKPPEAKPAPVANGTEAPGVFSKPLPPPPPPTSQGAPLANPTRGPPPGSVPPPPMHTGNGPRPMPPGGSLPVPPPPPVGSGTMANFTPGTQVRPPPMMPQGFPGQQIPGQGVRPPPQTWDNNY
ncbi:hypothetical protein IFM89_009862 [Coptis chinensis]|uniref:SF3A2 domain-containing protein n=1 Tax=Coptis chinensis TaxID=261450 RepID=A0A835I108_9MAGN|nr:hypothetical protein IFM89_009862 [Coptis chinensis]